MASKLSITALGALALTVSAGAQGRSEMPGSPRLPTHVLDLVVVSHAMTEPVESVPVPDRLMPPTHRGGGDHSLAERLPIELSVLSLDRNRYGMGESLFFELLLQNTGSREFAFPASLDGRRFRRGMPGATVGAIALVFQDAQLSRQVVALQILYGAETVPGSLIVIQPGETLSIRAEGEWILHGRVPGGGWMRDVDVRAQLDIYHPDRSYPLVTSGNTFPVRLEGR